MGDFFRIVLFQISSHNFTVADLVFSILILAGVSIGNVLIFKLLKRIGNHKLAQSLRRIVSWISGVAALTELINLVHPSFWKIVVFSNKWFKINNYDFIFVVSVPILAFFVVRLLRILLIKAGTQTSRNSIIFIGYLIWSISLSYIAKALFRDFSKITEIELAEIKKISITLYDLWFLTIVISVTALGLRGLKRIFDSRVESLSMDAGTGAAIFQIFKYLAWITAVIVSLQTAGFDITLILAGSAALLVGLGIGIQKVFSDIASGVILLIERPLKGGDVVETTDGIIGVVQHIGLRTTTLLTREDTYVRVPNSTFINENIENYTDEIVRTRFDITVGVAYGSDVELVMKVLKACATEHPQVEQTPAPFVQFNDFGASALIFKLFFFTTENFRFEGIKSDIRIAIDREFRKNGITIPFPQQDVHIIEKQKFNAPANVTSIT